MEKIPCYQKSQYIWIKRFIEVNKDWDEGMINERAERLSAVYYKEILKQDLRSVYKELHADHETGATDNK